MHVVGSRNRKCFFLINETEGEHRIYRIRRLKCPTCNKIHHELPSFMVPYKRQCTSTITRILEGNDLYDLSKQVIEGIQHWFMLKVNAFIGLMKQLFKNQLIVPGCILPNDTLSKLDWLKSCFNYHPKWLSCLVHALVFSALWPQTRLA